MNGIHEVAGSIPASSTITLNNLRRRREPLPSPAGTPDTPGIFASWPDSAPSSSPDSRYSLPIVSRPSPRRLDRVATAFSLCTRRLLATVLLAVVAQAHADTTPDDRWFSALDSVQAMLREPTVDAEAAAQRLAAIRREMSAWIAAHPESKVSLGSQEEEPVAELNTLRAGALALQTGREARQDRGVFYLGRVDVTVSESAPPPGVTVLAETELRQFDRSTFAGVFTLAPGVTASKVGSRNEDAVYLRGFDLRQVPLYIDGIPVYVPYDGNVDLARFLTSDVGEVRVSRGMTSNLYGPNTLGGALNVVSRRPEGRIEGLGSVSLGSGDRRDVDGLLGTRRGGFYATAGAGYSRRDTYPLSGDFQPTNLQPGDDRENAYSRDRKLNGGVGYITPGGSEYALRVVSQRGEKGNPPYAGTDPSVRARFWQWPYWDKDSVYGISHTRLGMRRKSAESGYVSRRP